MANIIRTAKSGNDWTVNELTAYHIETHLQQAPEFFGVEELPLPQIDEEIINVISADDMVRDSNAELISHLELVMNFRFDASHESAVDDFAVLLFRTLGYAWRRRVARTWTDIPLFICGEDRYAKTDVCIFDQTKETFMLLVQEDKCINGQSIHAPAQLIAAAIAAFNYNNQRRVEFHLPEVEEQVMPGIILVGSMPTFFKIPITKDFANHIHLGTYPPDAIQVTFCYPPVPRLATRFKEGMIPLDNRRAVLQCYEAFKQLVGI